MRNQAGGYDEPRFVDSIITNAVKGRVDWSAPKSIWISGMYLVSIVGGYYTFSFENLTVFLLSTAIVLCLGHSLGMHRRLIHNSFECPLWLEYIMVYLGTLVGLGGPLNMIHTHDIRDWAQRKSICHDYYAHRQSFLKDAWWQMHCNFELDAPPTIELEDRVVNDKFYQFIEKTWMLQQLPLALLFYLIGDLGWVVWGICVRVAVSVTGHWLIGYFAHRAGDQDWHVSGAGVQGYNIRFTGLITFGECWHNNHHAFPGSAKIGINKGQSDPGWWVLLLFKRLGIAWNLQTPETIAPRKELQPATNNNRALIS